jgi:hypothetical protein
MIGLKLSLPYWLRRVHIADNIRKPSEVLRKFLAGSNDSFLSDLLIPTVNEVVWTKGIPNSMSYVLEILDY